MENKVKSFFKKGKNTIKNMYNTTTSFVSYLFSQSLFYIVNEKNDRKKILISSFDKENLELFIKICNVKSLKKILESKCYIIEEGEKERYIVESYDFNNTYDYLLKSNDKYKAIKCYKIKLNKEIIDI